MSDSEQRCWCWPPRTTCRQPGARIPTAAALPHYYTDALKANGIGYDVYDVDRRAARRRTRSACSATTRRSSGTRATTTSPASRASRPGRARRGSRSRRDRASATSSTRAASCSTRASAPASSTRRATSSATSGSRSRTARPATRSAERLRPAVLQQERDGRIRPRPRSTRGRDRPERPDAVRRLHRPNDDFLQYCLGAYIYVSGGNTALETDEGGYLPFNMTGTDAVQGPHAGASTRRGAGNQDHTATFAITELLLDPTAVPAVRGLEEWRAGCDRAPGRSARSAARTTWPRTRTAPRYKRLGKTIDLTGKTSGELKFKFSYDTEENWDYMMVEAHVLDATAQATSWTTLPDTNGHTTRTTGDSCAEGLANGSDALHPFLLHYRPTPTVRDPTRRLTGTGTLERRRTGNSAAARTGGRPEPVRGQAGRAVRSPTSDWGTLGLGTLRRRRQGHARRRGHGVDRLRERHRRLDRRAAARGDGLRRRQLDPRAPSSSRGRRRRHHGHDPHRLRLRGHAAPRRARKLHGATRCATSACSRTAAAAVAAAPAAAPVARRRRQARTTRSASPRASSGSTSTGARRCGCPAARRSSKLCRGIVALARGKKAHGPQVVHDTANKNRNVTVRIKKSAYKRLKRKGKIRTTITVVTRGSDGVLRKKSQRVTMVRKAAKKAKKTVAVDRLGGGLSVR